jgi:hypothetical protein
LVIEFRNLMIAKPAWSVPGYRKGQAPDHEIEAVAEAFTSTLPRMIATWSQGRVSWRNEVVVSPHLLRTTGGGGSPARGHAEWLTEIDIRDDLRDHVEMAQYDCIFVYPGYHLDDAGGYGGPGPLGAGLVTYGRVAETDLDYDSESLGGMFHEWCHGVAEPFYRDLNRVATVPGIHHEVPDPTWQPAEYGRDTGGRAHWLNWYMNYINGTIRSRNGRTWGLGERCWRLGTPRDHFSPRPRHPRFLGSS